MAIQYANWRRPDGRPAREGDRNRYAPTASLAELGQTASIPEPSKIQWKGWGTSQLKLPIRSTFCVLRPDGRELNDADAWAIGWRAIRTIIRRQGGGKPLLPKNVLEEADKEAGKFFREPERPFSLITSISLLELPTKRIRLFRRCVISSVKRRGERYAVPAAAVGQAQGTPFGEHLASSPYLTLRVRVSARTPAYAFHEAIDSLNFVAGLWNLAVPRGQPMFSAMGHERPLANILIGPIHTLHPEDGERSLETWWYDPDFMGDQQPFSPRDGWSRIETFRKWAINKVLRSPFRVELEELVIRYSEAVAQPNFGIAFLQLWSLLEKITDTVGASYDETVRRAAWIYADRKFATEALEAARLRRNLFVHAARHGEDREQIAHVVRQFVADHLRWLLRNTLGVQSVIENAEYLRLSTDVGALCLRRKRLNKAITLMRKRGKKQAEDTGGQS